MDYKEIIEAMRSADPKEVFCRSIDAADAIETILLERDAAVEELRGNCWCCANGKPWEKAGPLSKMTFCEHLKEWGAVATCGKACKCQHWQWRGPQKEGGA